MRAQFNQQELQYILKQMPTLNENEILKSLLDYGITCLDNPSDERSNLLQLSSNDLAIILIIFQTSKEMQTSQRQLSQPITRAELNRRFPSLDLRRLIANQILSESRDQVITLNPLLVKPKPQFLVSSHPKSTVPAQGSISNSNLFFESKNPTDFRTASSSSTSGMTSSTTFSGPGIPELTFPAPVQPNLKKRNLGKVAEAKAKPVVLEEPLKELEETKADNVNLRKKLKATAVELENLYSSHYKLQNTSLMLSQTCLTLLEHAASTVLSSLVQNPGLAPLQLLNQGIAMTTHQLTLFSNFHAGMLQQTVELQRQFFQTASTVQSQGNQPR